MHGHWLKGYLRDGKEIEGGGGSGGDSGVMVVTLSGDNLQADKTFGEIAAALKAGKLVTVVGYPSDLPAGIDESRFVYIGLVNNTPPVGYSGSIFLNAEDRAVSYNENATAADYPFFADVGK